MILRIIDKLWLGNCDYTAEYLKENNIGAILNVAKEVPGPGEDHDEDIAYLHVPLVDGHAIPSQTVKNAIDFIDHHIHCDKARVLVHCKGGHSRSPAFIMGYLMLHGFSCSEAEALVVMRAGKDWGVWPNRITLDSVKDAMER
jgi:protein-tyrosine phosphatase